MRWSKILIPTLREDPHEAESASHRFLIRAGFIRMVSSGLYSFLPLGLRVLRKIENIIRQEMDRAGAQEMLMPSLQPGELWQKSGRWEEMGPELIRFKTRTDKDFVLGPTHEEIITTMVASEISSYRDLPANFYQIQTKFRDEARPRFGLIRAKEFIMKDAYSFDVNEEGLDKSYEAMCEAYVRIFERLGLKVEIVEADTGFMGGKSSQEFIAPSSSGEDIIIKCQACAYRASGEISIKEGDGCPRCQEGRLLMERGLELGHIFKLGTRYSESLGAKFLDKSGTEKYAIMGCYGIGVTRSLASIVEQNNDEDGIIWPLEVAPFTMLILPTDLSNKTLAETAEKLYRNLREKGYSVLLDDRPLRPGIKFKDADLIGLPLRITIGQKFIESGKIELRWRREKKIIPLTPAEVLTYIEKLIK